MKIAILGYGKMGREIERLAKSRNMEVASIIDRSDPSATSNSITNESVQNADVAIDFTHPDTVLENIKLVSGFGKNMVVGTTGWYKHLDEVKAIVKRNGTGFIYSPNFSIGVSLFLRIVE